jgi:hypothetical protein
VKKVSEKACTNANDLLQGLGCSTDRPTTATLATGNGPLSGSRVTFLDGAWFIILSVLFGNDFREIR